MTKKQEKKKTKKSPNPKQQAKTLTCASLSALQIKHCLPRTYNRNKRSKSRLLADQRASQTCQLRLQLQERHPPYPASSTQLLPCALLFPSLHHEREHFVQFIGRTWISRYPGEESNCSFPYVEIFPSPFTP